MSQFDNLSQENKDFLRLVGQLEEAAPTAPSKQSKAAPAVEVSTDDTEEKGA